MAGVLVKSGGTQRHREEDRVRVEAEIGGMLPQAKDCQATRSWRRHGRVLPQRREGKWL